MCIWPGGGAILSLTLTTNICHLVCAPGSNHPISDWPSVCPHHQLVMMYLCHPLLFSFIYKKGLRGMEFYRKFMRSPCSLCCSRAPELPDSSPRTAARRSQAKVTSILTILDVFSSRAASRDTQIKHPHRCNTIFCYSSGNRMDSSITHFPATANGSPEPRRHIDAKNNYADVC